MHGIRAIGLVREDLVELGSVEAIRAAVAEFPHATFWVDLPSSLSDDTKRLLSESFGIHSLTVEDVGATYLLPKLEEFDSFLYVLVHTIDPASTLDDLRLSEVDALLGPRWLITHHTNCVSVAALWNDRARLRRLLERGAPWLMHALVDRVVDDYLPITQLYDRELERLEARLFDPAESARAQDAIGELFALRRSLGRLRRLTSHEREIFARLSRGELALIPEQLVPFFRDVQDHIVRVAELSDSQRETAASLFDTHLSMQSQRLNEVMKVLTMISTVILPMTLIAGIYGMNFDHMPELRWPFGYPMALAAMTLVGVGVVAFFRRKDWL
ncbi:MAG TPA: magnesium/cobalt transporter CorA [Polyangiaceae bacterium]|nr:magnesium/cobalt transporter CorA [Polyangiaceae bacterium]